MGEAHKPVKIDKGKTYLNKLRDNISLLTGSYRETANKLLKARADLDTHHRIYQRTKDVVVLDVLNAVDGDGKLIFKNDTARDTERRRRVNTKDWKEEGSGLTDDERVHAVAFRFAFKQREENVYRMKELECELDILKQELLSAVALAYTFGGIIINASGGE